jgi:hypothetical protein
VNDNNTLIKQYVERGVRSPYIKLTTQMARSIRSPWHERQFKKCDLHFGNGDCRHNEGGALVRVR